ncbi:hypothetical protein CONPUDRAFT_68036 [Coniophora puteana RWD-64-598 SS2]|uniref:Phosphatidylglycerol phosphatidylinositol transfer protein n=1 Tax=Coniophora puteana (strain RWD-64-598) TaxID=741705 RepID=R7SDQ8_CONPW|nr:uncharacterized protein CONPUDRAFT_68036 [Coniophora puteana RWD-64-598 SS2]EIW74010.1 hypothetical protein CONPUDRAFT_68036 [Coniophora puteana RWD-64-598 SS2]
MKFSLAAATALFAGAAVAQNVAIAHPPAGASMTSGQNFTVQLNKANSLSPSSDIAVVIGLNSCTSGACPDPSQEIGYVLYSGPFSPSQSDDPALPPNQNFTVQIPPAYQGGQYQIACAHFSLIGVSICAP